MEERKVPQPGMIYRHFKNKLYQIIAIATHSETGEKMVVYQRLYDDFSVYVRPYDMFMSEVDHVKYPDVVQKYRFENILRQKENEKNDVQENLKKEKIQEEKVQNETEKDEISGCNPDLLAFLEADTYEEKRNLLIAMQKRVDDRLINDIASSLDVTVDDGDIDTRFKSLLKCLDTMKKFESVNRLR